MQTLQTFPFAKPILVSRTSTYYLKFEYLTFTYTTCSIKESIYNIELFNFFNLKVTPNNFFQCIWFMYIDLHVLHTYNY